MTASDATDQKSHPSSDPLTWAAMRVPRLDPKGATSAILDFVRGFAALLVVLSHVQHIFFALLHEAPRTLVQRGFYFVTTLGHSSVVVFFVLSGFFISGSVVKSVAGAKWRWDTYGIQRLARLYVPLIPAASALRLLGPARNGPVRVRRGLSRTAS